MTSLTSNKINNDDGDIRSKVSKLLSEFFDHNQSGNIIQSKNNHGKSNDQNHNSNNDDDGQQQHRYSIDEIKNFNIQLRNQMEQIFDRNEELNEELQLHLQYNRQLLLEIEKFEKFKNEIDELIDEDDDDDDGDAVTEDNDQIENKE